MTSAPRRVFLGWDAPLLPRAARWLLETHGQDLSRVVVALPGSRAARKLVVLLARSARADWTPPRVLTQGELVDELVHVDCPVASRLARTLAWERALRGASGADLARLAARRPSDVASWRKLAALLRTLHGELAPEGLDFAAVEIQLREQGRADEAARWAALARVQTRWRDELAREQLCDPHEARLAALDSVRVDQPIVLVGVADMNHLLRRALAHAVEHTTALVCAPEEHAASFDELGCLDTDAWRDADAGIPIDAWRVADRPADQAEEALRVVAEWNGRFAASAISIGVADEAVAPELERRFAAENVFARDAAGLPVERTAPARLVASARQLCERGTFREWAAFARHPDVASAIAGAPQRTPAAPSQLALFATQPFATRALTPATALDAYHSEHLPGAWNERWLTSDVRAAQRLAAEHALTTTPQLDIELAALERATRELLGALATQSARPLAEWPAELRGLLERVYAARELEPGASDDERVLARALACLTSGIDELEALPSGLAEESLTGADALALLLDVVAGNAVPPRQAQPGERAIELLGWLELALDDAPALVVTGFNEGRVPDSRRDDPFLPDTLRRALGLACDADRLARDVYAARVLAASREAVCFVSGRRSADGEPLLPSRITFRCPDGELLARARKFVGDGATTRAAHATEPNVPRPKPDTSARFTRDALSVSAFGDYLRSPYGFYLKHVLELETLDDSARELDARAFGNLAHDVLCAFGRDAKLRDAQDADVIERWLAAQLARIAKERYGERPIAAVRLQLLQLERRLALFARWQAERRAAGWRIVHCEWKPERSVRVPELEPVLHVTGRIDRIDERDAGGVIQRAILDYKTADEVRSPEKSHRSRKQWRDLQLPLYTLLAAELGPEPIVELGYVALGQVARTSGLMLAEWSDADLASAFETARDVARAVRAGEFTELGSGFPDDPLHRALAGYGLVGAVDADDEMEESA